MVTFAILHLATKSSQKKELWLDVARLQRHVLSHRNTDLTVSSAGLLGKGRWRSGTGTMTPPGTKARDKAYRDQTGARQFSEYRPVLPEGREGQGEQRRSSGPTQCLVFPRPWVVKVTPRLSKACP